MEVHERKGQIRIGSAVLTGCDSTEQVERFAAPVAAAEREACEPLIRQLVAALEGYRRNHNDTQPCDAERAGRAWLDGAP